MIISTQNDTLFSFAPHDLPQRGTFAGLVFVLATQGVAVLEIDGRPHNLPQGGLLTVLPSHLLATRKCSSDLRCLTLAFTFDSMADFPYMVQTVVIEKMERMPIIELDDTQMQKLENLHRIIAEHHDLVTHSSYDEILRSLVFVFTAEVSAIYSDMAMRSSATYREALIDSFFRLLHSHYGTDRSTSFYANRLCITSKHLAKVLVGVTGHSPTYWIADFTIREAKTLLKATAMTITQISEQLNFANSSFFARYFKRHTGVTPQEYRTNG